MRPDYFFSQRPDGLFLSFITRIPAFWFFFRLGRPARGLALLAAVLISAAACGAAPSRPRPLMEATLAQVKSQTLKGVLYNDEFASKASLSATYVDSALAGQLARQRSQDFKSLGQRDAANIFSSWSQPGGGYVFVAGIQGLNFKPEDLNPQTARWRLNLILLDGGLQPLAVIPAQLAGHGKNPRELIDYFPHLTNWDEVYTAFFTQAGPPPKGRPQTLRLELSGPSGQIALDFPAADY